MSAQLTLLGVDLTGRPVLVVGAGPVAARRCHALVDAGAVVTVVAPEASAEVVALAASGRVTHVPREVVADDVDGVWLVQACTGDPAVDAQVAGWAHERRVFCVVASDAAVGSARTPATARVGDVVVGVVSDAGPDPRRTTALRDRIAADLRAGRHDLAAHRSGTAAGSGSGSGAGATDGTPAAGPSTLRPGTVALVGGGTGDPELMTVRARVLLAQADVVVTDRLGPTAVLDELADGVEIVYVGKSPGVHQVSQDGINHLLVTHAREGRRVVRLKGGDPFLFGRGGEEVLACRAAGVEVQVVPGITSAVAAAEAAGIPVTHRGTSARVHVVNGHGPLSALDVAAMGEPDVTVVVLMGMQGLARLTAQAVTDGVDPATPAAVVAQATLPGQRVVRAPLGDLADRCAAAGSGHPRWWWSAPSRARASSSPGTRAAPSPCRRAGRGPTPSGSPRRQAASIRAGAQGPRSGAGAPCRS
ncbi:uroporphyrinogen-III C-methyltransferase [Cellulomonas sp. ATA003]|uniref:uroporphyrinogen-III C-methyltransferase n=1 Tax=Cellulomonas sp. ATA003 TaxID=3073064 RepID=UPI0028739A22|nr:uroporphyrinogen-III C-methyltransferase [Cellulomonas sp. ATA003]WNB85641.1 uroporphyrinogen-III C-methyltransferase [Cellulomonas sp. ATA003]